MTHIKRPFKFVIGIIFLILGLLFLLMNLNLIPDLSFINYFKGFWALGLILAGILIILKQRVIGVTVLVISIILGCLILTIPTQYDYEVATTQKELTINNEVQNSNYDINFGAGKLLIQDYKSNTSLVNVKSLTSFKQELIVEEEINENDNLRDIEIMQDINGDWRFIPGIFNEESKNEMNINLNSNYNIKKLNIDFGASESIIDLRNLNVEELDLEFGASDVTLYLDNNIKTDINCGASDIKLMLPRDKNILIETDGGLVDVNFEGFKKINDKYYNNYENKTIDIIINIDAGVSSISGGYYDE